MRLVVCAVTAVLFVTGACSRLPRFAAPQGGLIEQGGSEPADAITYRTLRPSDFKRTSPPGPIRHGQYECSALTCAFIRSSPDVLIEIRQPRPGEPYFEARARNVRFYSVMDRQCSWWNPKQTNAAYTLQHEQIHFAISEIAARRLDRATKELLRTLVVTGSSKQEVVDGISERIKSLAQQYVDDTLERNEDFDEDTSLGENQERQNEWWQTVQRELAETKGS
ncbi:MAG: hypothetical protein JW940_14200 [Polyangiaceae bacterium]|nr:hypothetical protein [Polyangiaceae bacterium]